VKTCLCHRTPAARAVRRPASYFGGPEDLSLEVATSQSAIDGPAWIDPEVVALAGISAAELERFRKPAEFASQGGAIAQPPLDWLEEFPNLAKFLDRIHARPAYKRALERGGTYAFGS
jgi:glutathione S-transferase